MASVDCVVVGGGPAGLSAALVLGRCTRSVVLADDGQYRNEPARRLNGFLTRDGIAPAELREIGRRELRRYAVTVVPQRVHAIRKPSDLFEVELGKFRVIARAVVLATGVVDVLPAIPGLDELFGRSIHHCPYCDGWEYRGTAIGIHGNQGAELARTLRTWSTDVVLFGDGPVEEKASLLAQGIGVVEDRVERFVGEGGRLRHVELAGGRRVPRRAVFLKLDGGQRQRSDLAQKLGIRVLPDGGLEHDGTGATTVAGLFVCGDATRDRLLSIVAAAEGAECAVQINAFLQDAR